MLVATTVSQGDRDNDYHYCVGGELVRLFEPCARDRRDPDGGCGCGRGLSSHRATTTARVGEVDMSCDEYAEAIRSSLEEQGWGSPPCGAEAGMLAGLVVSWSVGAIVQRRLDDLVVRTIPRTAS